MGLGSVGRTPGTALSPPSTCPTCGEKLSPRSNPLPELPQPGPAGRSLSAQDAPGPGSETNAPAAGQKLSLSPGPGCRHLRRGPRAAIHSFKYQKNTSLLPYLQQLLQDCLEKHPLPEVDLVIPVPCTGARNGSGALTRLPFWPGGWPAICKGR